MCESPGVAWSGLELTDTLDLRKQSKMSCHAIKSQYCILLFSLSYDIPFSLQQTIVDGCTRGVNVVMQETVTAILLPNVLVVLYVAQITVNDLIQKSTMQMTTAAHQVS